MFWSSPSSIGSRGPCAICLNILDDVAKQGAGFICLDVPALDTTSPYGQLLLNVLGSLAQFERSLILSRTKEGRTRARANGVRFGRKRKLTAYQIKTAKRVQAALTGGLFFAGGLSCAAA
jgi:DNA invertase Pin-like site-specific DNA recombinase